MSPSDDWYRSPDWDPADQRLFDEKLQRARAWNRPQYRRIKGLALLEAGDDRRRDAGRNLFRRVIDEHPDAVPDLVVVRNALGRSLAREGDLEGAIEQLRTCLDLERSAATSQQGRPSTSPRR